MGQDGLQLVIAAVVGSYVVREAARLVLHLGLVCHRVVLVPHFFTRLWGGGGFKEDNQNLGNCKQKTINTVIR